ncbi:hypothetical protein QTJ16_002184 [Diplocarpon rosae]|uniref:Uncharacterized protein n=1 Tax=Diplocarpon rosae TaxID=946125 RepID=A0AAD9T4K1_9HELO|nr:hypothetical protein QTJ16_002184 [Diplocarpon rosae]
MVRVSAFILLAIQALVIAALAALLPHNITDVHRVGIPLNATWSNSTGRICRRGDWGCEPHKLAQPTVTDAYQAFVPSNVTWSHSTGRICRRDSQKCAAHRLPVLDSFSDVDEPQIDDIDYYRFSTENVVRSRVDSWYATWSVVRQNDTEWTELGEWKLFAKDFGRTYNFECDLVFGACVDYPSLGDLQKMWPGDRVLVRRIFFTFHRYTMAHAYVKSVEQAFDRTNVYLIGLVPQIVSTFSLQVDPKAKLKCERLHAVITTAVSVGQAVLGAVLGGLIAPEMTVLTYSTRLAIEEEAALQKELETLAPATTRFLQVTEKIAEKQRTIAEGVTKVGPLSWLTIKLPGDKRTRKTGTARDIAWVNSVLYGIPMYMKTFYDQTVAWHNSHRQVIDPSIAHGHVCSDYEGDFQGNKDANRDNLGLQISSIFESTRLQRTAVFEALYHGVIAEPGQPSGTAHWFESRDWNEVLMQMESITDLEEVIKRAMVKSLISDTITSDFNYIKCGFDQSAPRLCKASLESGKADSTVFCPHPDTDPQFMCDAKRWYFADHHAHDRKMAGAGGFETFAGGRFNFTTRDFLLESFRNYEQYGYANPENFGAWGHDNSTSQSVGFRLPVCITDKPRFGKKGYPAICGDWHSSQTAAFIDAMNAGMNSTIYKYRHDKSPMKLYTEIIPQALDDFPPLTRYLGLCDQSLRFPHTNEHTGPALNWLKIQQGKDKDCGMIKAATLHMEDEEQANRWFCTNQIGHSIFRREHFYTDSSNGRFLKSHKRRCEAWIAKNGRDPKDRSRPGT